MTPSWVKAKGNILPETHEDCEEKLLLLCVLLMLHFPSFCPWELSARSGREQWWQQAVVTASLVTVVAPGVRLDGEQWPSTPWPQLLELISRGTNTIQPLLLPTQTNYWELVTISVCMEQQLFVMVSGWQQTPLTGRSLTCHHGERSFNGNFIWNMCPRDDNASVPLPAQVSTSQGAVSDTQHIQSADQLLPPWYFKSKLGVGKVLSYFSFNQFTSIKTWANLSDCTAALPFSRKLD